MSSHHAEPITKYGALFCVPAHLRDEFDTLLRDLQQAARWSQTPAVTKYLDGSAHASLAMSPDWFVWLPSDEAAVAVAAKLSEKAIPFDDPQLTTVAGTGFDISRIRITR